MEPKHWSLGLGLFSIGLGLAEVARPRAIARRLGHDHAAARVTIRLFGARELLSGAGILAAPAHSTRVWNRVAGDALDLAALVLASRRRPLWAPIAFVMGATVADIVVARALDRKTGKMLPVSPGDPRKSDDPPAHSLGSPTTMEPEGMACHQAPPVPERQVR
ncbi:hypothetical protein EWH08_07700 [Sphingobium indicum]|uniref:DUF4267 domain-containing protein n=2 Tax=Sphingobium indicum TaxID=332055 RepID=A0A1L5BNW2_SPHIB|nr:hypothetical protein [Sphingobium indicum]APL94585.1 hypothetical protein SIDU_08765 [Sphingobium indicum B90A]KEY97635.1 hypothetical protein AI27_17295 [Sphingomonas sp. BHC-A]NYI23278.1 hypothetical protein [Sphingobium indicum]RYM04335.1 hypothetical protein EWH08_07700 [Sphingobium indicum]